MDSSLKRQSSHYLTVLAGMIQKTNAWLACAGMWLAPPVARIAVALPFFRSGLTRWDGLFILSPSTSYLFEEEFQLHIIGGEYAIPFPDVVAFGTGLAEICLPILLILGLGTRFAALGLLMMTGVIQLVIPDGWVNFHLYWAALALAILAMGPGPISIDQQILSRWLQHFRRVRSGLLGGSTP